MGGSNFVPQLVQYSLLMTGRGVRIKGINIVEHLLCARLQSERYYYYASFSEWEKKKLRRIEKLENSHITSKAAKMELK